MFTSSPAANDFAHPIWVKSNTQRTKLLIKVLNQLYGSSSKSILDVGAGDFSIAEAICKLGHDVLALEPRAKEANLPASNFRTYKSDVDSYLSNAGENIRFDIVMMLGLLYHLERPQETLRRVSAISDSVVIIDSVVLDHDGDAIVYLEEDREIAGHSVNGLGCRPSFKWLINKMRANGFEYYYDLSGHLKDIRSDGLSTGHLYNWKCERTCGWRRNEMQLRKFIVFSRAQINI